MELVWLTDSTGCFGITI